jgi:Flp pilus assembly protein TadD/ferredoxin
MKWEWLPEYGAVVPRQPFTDATRVADLWATMPPWYVAVPFLFVCGFAIVYFLGNKSFCSFGCPYGGFFGVADRFALGKIKVDDNCHQCGHCTAVCTSNVRVHEQVRDYGQVIDPGCMKTMDCISSCPNDALSYGFGLPNLFAKPRNADADVRVATAKKNYDLTMTQDVVLFAFGVVMFLGYRSMWNLVPLLMAGAIAAIAVYFAWVFWQVARRESVRAAHMQVKLKGKLKAGGVLVLLLGALVIGGGLWGGAVNFHLWRADMIDLRVDEDFEKAFSKGYVPKPEMQARAQAALWNYRKAGPWSEGGFGWPRLPKEYKRMAWLAAVAGDLTESEKWLRVAATKGTPVADTFTGVVRIMEIQSRPKSEQIEFLKGAIEKNPKMPELRLAYFNVLLMDGQIPAATIEADALAKAMPDDAAMQHLAGIVNRALNRGVPALSCFNRAVDLDGKVGMFEYDLAVAHGMAGDIANAEKHLVAAAKLEPTNMQFMQTLAQFYRDIGNEARAKEYDAIVADLLNHAGAAPAHAPGK